MAAVCALWKSKPFPLLPFCDRQLSGLHKYQGRASQSKLHDKRRGACTAASSETVPCLCQPVCPQVQIYDLAGFKLSYVMGDMFTLFKVGPCFCGL
jgi:hypothetical protein